MVIDKTILRAQTVAVVLCIALVGCAQSGFEDGLVDAPIEAPEAPKNLAAFPGDGKVLLTWAPSSRAQGYEVLRSERSGHDYEVLDRLVGPDASSLTDQSVVNHRAYHYLVTAHNPAGTSADSNEVSVTPVDTPMAPAAPDSLRGEMTGAGAHLEWSAAPDVAGYRVLRATSFSGPYEQEQELHRADLTYLDTSVQAGATYFYIVRSFNASGESERSAVTRLEVEPFQGPLAPSLFSGQSLNGHVVFRWVGAPGSVEYRLYHSTEAETSFELLTTLQQAAQSHTEPHGHRGLRYYKISGVDGEGNEGLFSPVILVDIP